MGNTWNDTEWTDIGGGMSITPITDEGSGRQVGLMERHVCKDGRDSRGYVPFEGASIDEFPHPARWQVVQADPLTLHGSIQCHSCPNHGWIRDGRWVAA